MHLLAKVVDIAPSGEDLSVMLEMVAFPQSMVSFVNEAFGTTLTPANKLAFSATSKNGINSYMKNTGLIAEANKILFGDEANASQYPGVAAAGASYNIAGPLVKNIKVSLAIRPYTGVATSAIGQQVASAVAAVVNKAPIGKHIAISSLVSAAQSVSGVVAVAVLSPSYNAGDDLISVQPYEKPMVLDLANDITVTFVGE
jgi:hypothetical protein